MNTWENDKNYYQKVVDLELCYCRDFGENYTLEISGWKKNIISLYLWKNNNIVGSYCSIPKELFKKYENILVKECIEKGNDNFRNTYSCIILDKAEKILQERGEKITKTKLKSIEKEIIKEEIKNEIH